MADEVKRPLPPGTYWVVGGEEPDDKRASFRLAGDALDPDVITQQTGLTPDVQHRKGDVRPPPRDIAVERRRDPPPWKSGIWTLSSEGHVSQVGARLEDHVRLLLDQLEPVADTLGRLRASQGLTADFFCGFFMHQSNSSIGFSAETLTRIAALGAELAIDIYGPDPEDADRIEVVTEDA